MTTTPDLTPLKQRFEPKWYVGIDTGPGWFPLLLELDAKLAAIDPDYRLLQVKEKFGGLRFYAETKTGGPEFFELIREAERRSYSICEECGEVGRTGNRAGGWTSTYCESCKPKGWTAFSG